ncbi:heme exporter protein CcmB [Gilvimarinus sp. F26214L]|uniref:heme exporter protein CcmB n=1 Tax=Gilvimarinus sp. DZF01 TaxID=3461371 RepID=UPI0040454A21
MDARRAVAANAPLGTSAALWAMFRRDLLLAYRHRGELLNPVLFFFLVSMLIPLGVSPEPEVLSMVAPGIIWVMALLATLLSMDGLFRSDFDDGTLEQLVVSPHPLYLMVLTKVAVHWLVTGLPLTLVSPLLGLWMSLPGEGFVALFLTLLIGTVSLSMIGAIGAGLTVSLRRGGVLISLIIIPFYTPVLLFGTVAVSNAITGLPYGGLVAILGSFMALSMGLAPLATAGAIKISINN